MSTHSNLREAIKIAMLDNLGLVFDRELGGHEYPALQSWCLTGDDRKLGPALAEVGIATESSDDTFSIYELDDGNGGVSIVFIYENGNDEPDMWEMAEIDGS